MLMINRRRFLQTAGTLAALGRRSSAAIPPVSLVVDPTDPIANSGPPRWAIEQFKGSMTSAGATVQICQKLAESKQGSQPIIVAGSQSAAAQRILKRAGISLPEEPEALGIVPGGDALLVTGHDARGLVFAVLDLDDRVQNGAPLIPAKAVLEKPHNRIRSMSRLFTSDVEDKPWYNDREMWPQYLTMLATHRFNRFNLALGIGYDFIRQVTDAYFLFSYPFLIDVPGYKVRVPQLPDRERD